MTAREVKIILDAMPDEVLDQQFTHEEYGEPVTFSEMHLIPYHHNGATVMLICCGHPFPPVGSILLEPKTEPKQS